MQNEIPTNDGNALTHSLNTIFFIGPQGSGKGTQAKLLAKKLNFFYWEMGGILREVSKQPDELGIAVKNLIDNGVLLEDEMLLKVVKNRLDQIAPTQGVIFDGIPRRIGQAEFLLNFLKTQGRKNFTTIFINIPKEESINRLLLRAEKESRKDDTKEAIELRLKQYYEATVPVLNFLKTQSNFIEIDGTPSIEIVTENINKNLNIQN
jgi:adenylate kinase